jgi:hypothetical protein
MHTTFTDTIYAEISVDEKRRLMAEFSITRHGRYYHFDTYRYELLSDAIAFAEIVRARSPHTAQRPDPSALEKCDDAQTPNAADQQLMQEFSISLQNYSFVFEGFRYDRLIDAVNYARHRRELGAKADGTRVA